VWVSGWLHFLVVLTPRRNASSLDLVWVDLSMENSSLSRFSCTVIASDFQGTDYPCIYSSVVTSYGAHGSIAGWGTMLQAGRSWVRFLMRSLDFSVDILSAALCPWGRLKPLTEMSTRNLLGGTWWPVHGADHHLWADVWKMWEPRHLTALWPVTGIALVTSYGMQGTCCTNKCNYSLLHLTWRRQPSQQV
jgi:hypothetical protein